MITFEVHRLVGDRWMLDAVFDDQAAATAAAKSSLASARRPMAVRVLACKEDASRPEEVYFIEWVVHREKATEQIQVDYSVERPADPDKPAPPVKPRVKPAPPAQHEPVREPAARQLAVASYHRLMERSAIAARPPIGLLVVVLLLGAFFGVLAHRISLSQTGWIFDSPEAHQPHAVRNPLTGEYYGRGTHP